MALTSMVSFLQVNIALIGALSAVLALVAVLVVICFLTWLYSTRGKTLRFEHRLLLGGIALSFGAVSMAQFFSPFGHFHGLPEHTAGENLGASGHSVVYLLAKDVWLIILYRVLLIGGGFMHLSAYWITVNCRYWMPVLMISCVLLGTGVFLYGIGGWPW